MRSSKQQQKTGTTKSSSSSNKGKSNSNSNSLQSSQHSQRVSHCGSQNKENEMYPIQAHYQQYLQLQKQQQQQMTASQQQYYQVVTQQPMQYPQKNSLNSNNFHSSDMSLSQSSHGDQASGSSEEMIEGYYQQFNGASSLGSGLGYSTSQRVINLGTSSKTEGGPPSFFKSVVGTYQKKQQPLARIDNQATMLISNQQASPQSQMSQQYEGLNSINSQISLQPRNTQTVRRSVIDLQQIQVNQQTRQMTTDLSLSSSSCSQSVNDDNRHTALYGNREPNSAHKHLRFDSLQLSSNHSGRVELSLRKEYQCNFVELLPLASPDLSSTPSRLEPSEKGDNVLKQHLQNFIEQSQQ